MEKMRQRLERLDLPSEPAWVYGTTKRDNHLSGALRDAADAVWGPRTGIAHLVLTDEELKLVELLSEAAETLDDAHEEWMEDILCQTKQYGS